jgi:hypothetical protein
MKLVRIIKMCLNETYSRVWVGRHLSEMFPIKNGFRKGDKLSPLFFNCVLECANRRLQVNQGVFFKLNDTHQPLVYADDVNVWDGSVHSVKAITEALAVSSKENGLEVNADKTKNMFKSRDPNAEGNHNTKTDNASCERVEHFEYLRKKLTNQNSLQEEYESRSKSVSACYHSEQNLLSFIVSYKKTNIKIYRNIILPVVLYECETSSLTLRKKSKLCLLENRELRGIFDEVRGGWKKLHKNELNDLYSSPNIIR